MEPSEWAEFVRSSPARRYLFARGESALVPIDESERLPPDDVADFLAKLGTETDVELVGKIYLLLNESTQQFINRDVPRVLRGLTHVASRREAVTRGGLRGRVQWSTTLRAQSSGRLDGSQFVVHDPHRTANRPENQLLKYALERLASVLVDTASSVGSGALPSTLRESATLVQDALREPRLRDVERPRRVTPQMRRLAHRHKDSAYGAAADLVAALDALESANRWQITRDLVATGWLSPIDPDDLFELYVLTLTLDVLERDLDFVATGWGLIRAGRSEVASLDRSTDGCRAKVHFDQSPDSISDASSRYRDLTKNHLGIEGRGRRPDVVVRLVGDGPNADRWLLIEVKKSSDGQYVRDSLYKVFGYVYDFAPLFTGEQLTDGPSAVLVFPSGVHRKGEPSSAIRLISGDDRARLAEALREFVPGP